MKITSQELVSAVQRNLNDVAECNGDGWVYEVGECKITEDGTVRIAIKTIVPDSDDRSWDGSEGDLNIYDIENIDQIADDILGNGPSLQGATDEEIVRWIESGEC